MARFFRKIWTAMMGGTWNPPDDDVVKNLFPKRLQDFGYAFNEKGQLRHIKTGNAYEFLVKQGHHRYNQMRYEALGDVVTEYVYNLMEKDLKLKRVTVPIDAIEGEPKSFIFMSEDALTNPNKLMVLIHGSGAVRAGQWSRKLIINDCLDSGSQLPYIRKGLEEGYGIIVMNPNLNTVRKDKEDIPIRGNDKPENHGEYVWKHFVSDAAAKNVAIVAHSYGGIVTLNLVKNFASFFTHRVFAVAFTDSVHSFASKEAGADSMHFLQERAVNFASSYDPKNTPLQTFHQDDCPAVSAGTDQHEMTSWMSFDLVFDFLSKRYDRWVVATGQVEAGAEQDLDSEKMAPPTETSTVMSEMTSKVENVQAIGEDLSKQKPEEPKCDQEMPENTIPAEKDGGKDNTVSFEKDGDKENTIPVEKDEGKKETAAVEKDEGKKETTAVEKDEEKKETAAVEKDEGKKETAAVEKDEGKKLDVKEIEVKSDSAEMKRTSEPAESLKTAEEQCKELPSALENTEVSENEANGKGEEGTVKPEAETALVTDQVKESNSANDPATASDSGNGVDVRSSEESTENEKNLGSTSQHEDPKDVPEPESNLNKVKEFKSEL